MAENKNFSHDSHSPFRRYVPPANNGNGTQKAPLMPFPQPSAPSPRPVKPSPENLQRHRPNRNRWRQLVNVSPAPKTTAAEQRRPIQQSHPPRQSLVSQHVPNQQPPIPNQPSSVTSATETSRRPRPPVQVPQAHRRHQVSSAPSALSQPLPGQAAPRQPTKPYPSRANSPVPRANKPRRTTAQGIPPQNSSDKVTPLRRKPVWSTPAEVNPAIEPPRRDRKPRRTQTRRAPRPILYGIRLLILGTGIAAITGTILSTLNSRTEVAVSNPAANGVAEASAPQRGLRNPVAAALTQQPLPLAEELVHLKTDLAELGALAPGLSQSVFLYDLDTGNYVDLEGGRVISAASTIKVPILVAFLEAVDAGNLRLDQAVTLQEQLIGGGSGDMQTHEIGSRYTALEVATEMIVNSDNTATNMMINLLGGRDLLNRRFQEWGLEATVLRNPLPDLEGTNTTSSTDLAKLMVMVDRGELLDVRSRDRLFSIMQRTYNRTLIPDGLSDPGVLAFNKTGDIGTVLGDIALVDVANGKRYILGIMVERPHNDGRASELIRRIAGRTHEEMSQPITPVGGTPPSASSTESSPPEPSQPDATIPNNEAPSPAYPETDSYEPPGVPRG